MVVRHNLYLIVDHTKTKDLLKMGMFTGLVKTVQRLHLNYNMITSLYMMEPMERTIISKIAFVKRATILVFNCLNLKYFLDCVVILVLSLMMYSSWVYLPHYTLKLLYFSGILPKTGQFGTFEDDDDIIQNSEL